METKNITLWGFEKDLEDGKTGIVIGLCDECIWGFASEALKSVKLEDGILVMTDGITEIRCDPKSVYPPEYSEEAFRDIFSGMDGAELDRILDSIRDTIEETDKEFWANTKFWNPLKLGNGGDTADTEEKESSMEREDLTGWLLEKYKGGRKGGFVVGWESVGHDVSISNPLESVRLEDGALVMTDDTSEIRCAPEEAAPFEFDEDVFREIFSGVETAELDRILDGIRDAIAKAGEA